MITIHLDGQRLEIGEGSTLGSILPDHPHDCCVAVIRPATKEQEKTGYLAISTSAGEITIEVDGERVAFLELPEITKRFALHWADRYVAAFGPFPSSIRPLRKPHLYERGEVILGCGGYDPVRSYFIFSKSRHSADHGADDGGGVIGRVVSGRAVLDRWTTGDRITRIEPVISWADTSRSFTTTDRGIMLENGMQIVTYLKVMAQGYAPDRITTEAAGSVEHLLIALQKGRFKVERATSTHILDSRLAGTEVPKEFQHPRREGTVTVRTAGRSAGGIYIYRVDVPSTPAHSVVGQVLHGIELAKLAKEDDVFSISVLPERIDLLGLPLSKAKEILKARGVALRFDADDGERIVVSQEPGTTLDVLNERAVMVTTAPDNKVIDIELYDTAAPLSCEIFRQLTGLKEHGAGMIPLFFMFDDVFLFKPDIPTEVKIIPENQPKDEVPAAALGITNDTRKGVGIVGVRLSGNKEFGPTSEPFEGTNIIGRVLDTVKMKNLKERDKMYIREVRR